MISSAPRLNVLVEFVTNASITLSLTPESASRMISDTALVGLILGGKGFSLDTASTGASAMSVSCAGLVLAAFLGSTVEFVVASPASAFVVRTPGRLIEEAGSTHEAISGMDAR